MHLRRLQVARSAGAVWLCDSTASTYGAASQGASSSAFACLRICPALAATSACSAKPRLFGSPAGTRMLRPRTTACLTPKSSLVVQVQARGMLLGGDGVMVHRACPCASDAPGVAKQVLCRPINKPARAGRSMHWQSCLHCGGHCWVLTDGSQGARGQAARPSDAP